MKSVGEGQDNKIEIQSRTTNLLDVTLTPSMQNYVSYKVNNDKSVTLTQTVDSGAGRMIAWSFLAKANKKYTFSGDFNNPNGNSVYLRMRDIANKKGEVVSVSEQSTTGSMSITFSFDEDTDIYIMPYLAVSGTTSEIGSTVTWSNLQLEEGTTKTSYSNYELNKKEIS